MSVKCIVAIITLCCLNALVARAQTSAPIDHHAPQQVHLALGTDVTEMLVTWVTKAKLPAGSEEQHVLWGSSEANLTTTVHAEVFPFEKYFVTYRALITKLQPEHVYFYKVGSKQHGYSKVFRFRTMGAGSKYLPRIAIYGDLGLENSASRPFIKADVARHEYDMIIHAGDFAYDLYEQNSERGSQFMRNIEPIAAYVPYMTIPGNHEYHFNFSHYQARFSMLGDRHAPRRDRPIKERLNNFFWSMDVGPIHFVMYNAEFYFFTQFGYEQIERQFRWLEEDLKRANANRHQVPWIIAIGHRGYYCFRKGEETFGCDYTNNADERPNLRRGVHMHGKTSQPREFGIEKLFYDNGVDVYLYGHEHFYARNLPVYNDQIEAGPNKANPYENARAPILIGTGSAGNRELHSTFLNRLQKFVAFHALDYGYTRLSLKGERHIHFEQVSDERHGAVIDSFEVVKNTSHPSWML